MKLRHVVMTSVFGCVSVSAHATFMPKNDLYKQDNVLELANMTEQEFNDIIARVVDTYKPIIKQDHSADLTSNNLWNDATVNASAVQYGNSWQLNMYGGLARRPEVTKDGFTMVVCHELGHHLGGFPFYADTDWAASEGQADYFATQACAKYLWTSEKEENAKSRDSVDASAKTRCDAVYSNVDQQNLCYRTAMAGKSLAKLLAVLGQSPDPRFDTPDPTQVSSTNTEHPEAQCRLDTYFNGALCSVPFNKDVIPGRNNKDGQQSVSAEEDAAIYSCHGAAGMVEGLRPRCWFKPNLEFIGMRLSDFMITNKNNETNPVVSPGDDIFLHFKLNNASQKVSNSVAGTVSTSTPGVEVVTPTQMWGDINPGETKESQAPFTVHIADNATCGDKAEIQLKATSQDLNFFNSGFATVQFKQMFQIGRMVSANIGSNKTAIVIPDSNSTGINSEIVSTVTSALSIAKVTLHIKHTYPRDLSASLIAPNGLEVPFSLGNVNSSEIHATYEIPMKIDNAAGSWKLHLVDGVAEDEGTLQAWTLDVAGAVCK